MTKIEKQIYKEFHALHKFALKRKSTVSEILKYINKLDQKFGGHRSYTFSIDGVISNIAQDLRSLVLAKKALYRLRARIDIMPKPKFNYDSGNMLSLIANLKAKSGGVRGILDTPEFFESQLAFSKVVPDKLEHFERAYTNLANFLDGIGRNYESIYFYDKVLIHNPTFGMAAGNKARAILKYIESTTEASLPLLKTCSALFDIAISDQDLASVGGETVKDGFLAHKRRVDDFLHQAGYVPAKQKYSNKSKFLNFCLKRNLFLNFDFGYLYDKFSLEDSFFPRFIQNINDKKSKFSSSMSEKIHFSFHIFNQILEDFTTSRYIFYLSQAQSFKDFDKRTKYTYTLDYTKNSMKFGLIKRSFSGLYSVLEKLALIILNYTDTKNTFNTNTNVHLNALLDPKFSELAINLNNYHLLAMYSLARDFEDGHQYNRSRAIRNRISHSFLSIDVGLLTHEAEFLMLDTDLQDSIEHMFHIVKSAITYTVLFLEGEAEKAGNRLGSMYASPQKTIFKNLP